MFLKHEWQVIGAGVASDSSVQLTAFVTDDQGGDHRPFRSRGRNTFVRATVLSLNLLVHTRKRAPPPLFEEQFVQMGTGWLCTSLSAPRSSEPQPGCPGARHKHLAPSEQGGKKEGTTYSPGRRIASTVASICLPSKYESNSLIKLFLYTFLQ